MSGKDLRRGGLDRLTVEDILTPGFSTPWDAPTIPPFPFTFRNVEVLTLAWRTREAAVARLLPPPLEPTSDVVLAHVYRMNDVDWLGAYGESNVSVGCSLPGADIAGSYSPYLFLSSDVGVAHGREMHGQPKKIGEPLLENSRRPDGRHRQAQRDRRADRNHADEATARQSRQPDKAFRFRPQHQSEGDRPDRRPPRHPSTDRATTGRRAGARMLGGPCTVELRPNAQAPIHRLPVVDMLDGLYWRADFTLVPGRVIHDYLAAGA